MDILDILAQALAGGGGAPGGMPMSPSMMGPNGMDRQSAIPPGIRQPMPPIDGALLGGTSGNEAMLDTQTGAAGYAPPPSQGGGILSRVGQMFGGGNSEDEYNRTQMLRWLQEDGGMDAATAAVVASNPEMLQRHVLNRNEQRQKAGQPDWQAQTIFDAQGNEQRVLVDMNNPSQVRPMGGSKSSILSPEEEAQKVRLAQAGRTEINNNMPGQTTETAYDRELGQTYAKRYTETQTMAGNARKGLNTIAVMRQAMKDKNFYSGTASGAVQYGKRLLSSLGLSDADVNGVASMEQFGAMSKQAALDLMGGSLGSGFSNADRDFVTGQVANLGNTPEGNKALLDIQEKVLKRSQDIGRMATEYAKKNGGRIGPGFDDYLTEWSEKNPLFPQGQKTEQPWYRRDDQGPTRIRNNPQSQERWRATNPQTGEAIEWNGNAWMPAQ